MKGWLKWLFAGMLRNMTRRAARGAFRGLFKLVLLAACGQVQAAVDLKVINGTSNVIEVVGVALDTTVRTFWAAPGVTEWRGDDVGHWEVQGIVSDSAGTGRVVAQVGTVLVVGVPTIAGVWYEIPTAQRWMWLGAGVAVVVGVAEAGIRLLRRFFGSAGLDA